MSREIIILLMSGSLVFFLVLGYPIAFVMGGVAMIFGLTFLGPQAMHVFVLNTNTTLMDFILIAIPLFTFMGIMIEKSGIAIRLYDALHVILGQLRGGLLIATIIACAILATATGVIGVSVAIMGVLALPAMIKYDYDLPIATGSICAGGALGVLIPPSILLIVYDDAAGGVHLRNLFMGAIGPGLLLVLLYLIYIIIRCNINPKLGPALPKSEVDISVSRKLYLLFTSVIPVVVIIMAVLGSIIVGFALPTEAAGLGAFASVLLAAAYRKLTFQNLKEAVFNTMTISCMIYMVMFGASFFSGVYVRLGGVEVVYDLIMGLSVPNWGVLLTMFTIVFFMGMFLDWLGTIMIAVPIFTPIVARLGYDPVWFAMMMIIVMQSGFLTPPFAYSIFYLKGVAPPEVRTTHIYRGVIPFIMLQIIAVVLCWLFPDIILWLPNMLYNQ
ncbi:MAG: C4-dicarboxylate ABC transporter [Firmicutes bacterium HGW-Firmicutes-12]|nr:MAG: C4-dicarboxylate ABC transporter [Firmicutes bacterium HGW-Firmicutes-12]